MDIERIKKLFDIDREHSAEWRRQTPDDFNFYAGDQYNAEEKEWMIAKDRPMVKFNRTMSIINTVVGTQILNRQEVRYLPVEMGDAVPNDLWTSAGKWFDNTSECEDADSEAFLDACICGMGWTETGLNFDDNPDGDPMTRHIDPLEMYWDANARKKCLADATREWRFRRLPISEVRALLKRGEKADQVADSDFDADWAKIETSGDKDPKNQDRAKLYEDDDTNENDLQRKMPDHRMVTVGHLVIKKREYATRLVDPMTKEETWLNDEEMEKVNERMTSVQMEAPQGVRQRRTTFYQYILGREILDEGPLLVDSFPYKCITGYRDHMKGTWFGMIRGMHDPQRYANKWLAQSVHILNTMAKGGVIAERGAAEDEDQFEQSWSKSDEVTWVNPGGAERIKPKFEQRVPGELFRLIEFAISSIRDVPGVSLEMMGMRGAIQAVGVEQERKSAGQTVLAALFDSMRSYRLSRGKMILDICKKYLADGRLIRLVGADGQKYVPLMMQTDARFDVLLDENPSSPDVKERAWMFISPQIDKFPPQVIAELLPFSPLPASIVEKLQMVLRSLSAPDPMQEALKKTEVEQGSADVDMTHASAEEKRALAQKHLVDARTSVVKTITDAVQGAQQHGEKQQSERNRALSGGGGKPSGAGGK